MTAILSRGRWVKNKLRGKIWIKTFRLKGVGIRKCQDILLSHLERSISPHYLTAAINPFPMNPLVPWKWSSDFECIHFKLIIQSAWVLAVEQLSREWHTYAKSRLCKINIGLNHSLVPSDNKPLPEPMPP